MIRPFLLSFLFFFAFSICLKAQNKNVIWTEDFSGCYDQLPKKGMNVTYEYETKKAEISFATLAKGTSKPELRIQIGSYLRINITCGRCVQNVLLTFNVSEPKNIILFEDKIDVDSKKLKFSYSSNKITCQFKANNGKATKSIYIKVANLTRSSAKTVSIDDLVLTPINLDQTNSPELSFTSSTCTAFLNDNINNELINPHGLNVSYWSTDATVAQVDNNGKVTTKGVGRTTIYAICQGTNTNGKEYSYQSVSYNLTVKRKAPDGEIFYESFDKNLNKGGHIENDKEDFDEYTGVKDGEDGYLIFDNKNPGYAYNNKISYGYKCLYTNGDYGYDKASRYCIGPFAAAKGKKVFLSFRIAGGAPPKGEEANKAREAEIRVSRLSMKNTEEINETVLSKYTIPYTDFVWGNKTVELENVDGNTYISVCGTGFYLDDVSVTTKDVEKIEDVNIHVSEFGYATLYYSDRALVMPKGITAYTIKLGEDGNTAVVSRVYKQGDIIPKGEAVILEANTGDYIFQVADKNNEKDPANQLCGTDYAEPTTGGKIYYLFGGDRNNIETVGFFWGAKQGGAFTNGAHKAYLPLTDSSNNKAKIHFLFTPK